VRQTVAPPQAAPQAYQPAAPTPPAGQPPVYQPAPPVSQPVIYQPAPPVSQPAPPAAGVGQPVYQPTVAPTDNVPVAPADQGKESDRWLFRKRS
jgi:hypothetical protein